MLAQTAAKMLLLPALLGALTVMGVKPAKPQEQTKVSFESVNPWEAAEKHLDKKLLRDLMFMGIVKQDGKEIYLYKHVNTRRYINIDERGQTYSHDSGEYTLITRKNAVEWVTR